MEVTVVDSTSSFLGALFPLALWLEMLAQNTNPYVADPLSLLGNAEPLAPSFWSY
jgi:hypothetical protein